MHTSRCESNSRYVSITAFHPASTYFFCSRLGLQHTVMSDDLLTGPFFFGRGYFMAGCKISFSYGLTILGKKYTGAIPNLVETTPPWILAGKLP